MIVPENIADEMENKMKVIKDSTKLKSKGLTESVVEQMEK